MKTSIKQNIPKQEFYGLRDISTMVELTILIVNAGKKLKPCPCCGDDNPEKIDYWLKLEGDNPIHYFRISCRGGGGGGVFDHCGIQTIQIRAEDKEASIQKALDFIIAKWNRRPDFQERTHNKAG